MSIYRELTNHNGVILLQIAIELEIMFFFKVNIIVNYSIGMIIIGVNSKGKVVLIGQKLGSMFCTFSMLLTSKSMYFKSVKLLKAFIGF